MFEVSNSDEVWEDNAFLGLAKKNQALDHQKYALHVQKSIDGLTTIIKNSFSKPWKTL